MSEKKEQRVPLADRAPKPGKTEKQKAAEARELDEKREAAEKAKAREGERQKEAEKLSKDLKEIGERGKREQEKLLELEHSADGSMSFKKQLRKTRKNLAAIKKEYNARGEKWNEWSKAHPVITFATFSRLHWAPDIGKWALEKVDNFVDGILHKIEKWGEEQVTPKKWSDWILPPPFGKMPFVFSKPAVDWALWPIEKYTGRQVKPAAEERYAEKRSDKKEAEKLQKKSAKK